jgi:hypothetical protein
LGARVLRRHRPRRSVRPARAERARGQAPVAVGGPGVQRGHAVRRRARQRQRGARALRPVGRPRLLRLRLGRDGPPRRPEDPSADGGAAFAAVPPDRMFSSHPRKMA